MSIFRGGSQRQTWNKRKAACPRSTRHISKGDSISAEWLASSISVKRLRAHDAVYISGELGVWWYTGISLCGRSSLIQTLIAEGMESDRSCHAEYTTRTRFWGSPLTRSRASAGLGEGTPDAGGYATACACDGSLGRPPRALSKARISSHRFRSFSAFSLA